MNKELRFLNYLENKIKVSKDWAINCLILFLPTFVVCCMNFSKLLNFKTVSTVVGIGLGVIAWIGIVCIIKHFKTKKCKKIVEEIIEAFPVGEIISKNIDEQLKEKDKFLYSMSELYSKNEIVKVSLEHNENECFVWSIFLVFHGEESDENFKSSFQCDNLTSIKRLRDFLLN